MECGTLLDAPGPDPLEGEIGRLIKAGNKIAAIKLLREQTGISLREAKYAVDRYDGLPGSLLGVPALPSSETGSKALEEELLPLIRESRKLQAIKVYRDRTGAGLKEAKDAVEALAAREGIPEPRSGCFALLILAALGIATLLASL